MSSKPMNVPYRKKLIEVALPLKAINEASAKEKSIRHGHPSTLHLWWARRPLAACRAVLFASLVDDPDSDPAYRKADGSVDEDRAGVKRAQLFNLIEELVQWENTNNSRVINAARAEIARCVASRRIELGDFAKDTIVFGDNKGQKHPKGPTSGDGTTAWEIVLMKARPEVTNAFLAEFAPPVLDPFCGGGSIPLEAQRLGLRAFGSDLNPIPVLITKALIEIPPKFAGQPPVNPEWQSKSDGQKATTMWQGAQGLVEDVRYYGQWMRKEAEKRIGHLYPKVKITKQMAKDRPDLEEYVGQELTAIAWLWARTVTCPNPACGLQMPLARSFSVIRKGSAKTWVQPENGRFTMQAGSGEPPTGTVNRKGATCVWCKTHSAFAYVKHEGKAGRIGSVLLGMVLDAGKKRIAVSPSDEHFSTATKAKPTWRPEIEMPYNPFSVRPPLYGFTKFSDIHSARQTCALDCFSQLVSEVRKQILQDSHASKSKGGPRLADGGGGAEALADAIVTYLAFAVDRSANYWSCLTPWGGEFIVQTFGRQALPMIWDFAEANPFSDATGNWLGAIDWVARCLAQSVPASGTGTVTQIDARALNPTSCHLVSTDPPYYNNIDYADLSDFFYVWLRHSLADVYPMLFSTVLVPKSQELVATPYRFEGDKEQAKQFFESGLLEAFDKCRRAQDHEWPITVFYAFKQAEESDTDDEEGSEDTSIASTGWETMLEGLVKSGFSIDGTWPLRTERDQGLKTRMNALASSVVLVCRPRPTNAALATRKEFMNSLRKELPESLKNLQHGNIAPVDMAQAAIGPGMAVFTRYSKVIESDGSPMTIRTALGIINQVLDEVLAEQEGDFDADTRWALAWFDQHGMDDGPFGVAETLSKAKNTAINGLVEAGVVKAKAGKVRLVKRDELSDEWDPATDKRLTVWEVTQHLIRTLQINGESEAAILLNKLGGYGETARELAYRLFAICERKKWADEALAYNSLVIAWPELSKLALSSRNRQTSTQSELFT